MVTDWTTNPLTYGSYSDWPIGYTEDSHSAMKEPAGNLYFAGEHMNPNWFGFVHGAHDSGIEVGNQVVKAVLPPTAAPGNPTAAPGNPTAAPGNGTIDMNSSAASALLPSMFVALVWFGN
jgi:hypothetical protein